MNKQNIKIVSGGWIGGGICWIGREVTDDHRYKNNNLAERPYSTWTEV
ncbi:MAG: hypothetical protein K6G94_06615 [Kiritimatiellae bacterium]|nr:hypothetical protein [Kiritimatiellia bacterium]